MMKRDGRRGGQRSWHAPSSVWPLLGHMLKGNSGARLTKPRSASATDITVAQIYTAPQISLATHASCMRTVDGGAENELVIPCSYQTGLPKYTACAEMLHNRTGEIAHEFYLFRLRQPSAALRTTRGLRSGRVIVASLNSRRDNRLSQRGVLHRVLYVSAVLTRTLRGPRVHLRNATHW